MKRQFSFRTKVLGTLAIVLIYRLLSHIPLPGVDHMYAKAVLSGGSLNLLNILTGGNLSEMSIMALGITPYITASIILQLLEVLIPKLTDIREDGKEGMRKYKRITIYLAMPLGGIEAVGLLLRLKASGALTHPTFLGIAAPALLVTVNVLLLSLLCQVIDEKFFGNGTSLILLAGMLSSWVPDVTRMVVSSIAGTIPIAVLKIVLWIAATVLLFAFTTYISSCEKNIRIIYARKAPGAARQTGNIPIKLLGGGVVPIIFASTIITFPSLIALFFGATHPALYLFDMGHWFDPNTPWATIGFVLYLTMIIGFSYFYQTMSLSPWKLSDDLRQSGGTIAGVRPGPPTAEYLSRQMKYVTALGGIALCVIAAAPLVASALTHISGLAFFGTGVIIIVSVLEETTKAWQAERVGHVYKAKGVFGR